MRPDTHNITSRRYLPTKNHINICSIQVKLISIIIAFCSAAFTIRSRKHLCTSAAAKHPRRLSWATASVLYVVVYVFIVIFCSPLNSLVQLCTGCKGVENTHANTWYPRDEWARPALVRCFCGRHLVFACTLDDLHLQSLAVLMTLTTGQHSSVQPGAVVASGDL